MPVSDINTDYENAKETAKYISTLKVRKAYIAIPIRPPAEKWVKKPSEEELLRVYKIFAEYIGEETVELLNMPEPSKFSVSSESEKYILDVVRVHPLLVDYALKILSRDHENLNKKLEEMIHKGLVKLVEYQDKKYVVRRYMQSS